MRKMRSRLVLAIVFVLLLSFNTSIFAAKEVNTTVLSDGRVQVTYEFKDMKEAEWAAEYIGKMKYKNVFQGFEDGTFRPNQPVTRVEAVVMAVRLMGLEDEAKKRSDKGSLNFKDAKEIDKHFPWAKGYIAVALENGLFDASEDKLQPEKPASRVWISTLLVRSLGLKSEALGQMMTTPDFKDAEQIPAGSIGYVNVAVDHGIITGYPNGSFQPNKGVTRAEMAALLDRTNDGLLEKNGAIYVSGKVHEITSKGTLKLSTFNGDMLTYVLSSDLLVQFNKSFIRADQLAKDDVLFIVVKDNKVIEATLLDQKQVKQSSYGIQELEIEVEFPSKEEYEIKYKNKGKKVEAEIKMKTKSGKEKIKGEEALLKVEELLKKLDLSPNMDKKEITQSVLVALNLPKDGLKELEIEVKFSNGKKIEIEEKYNKKD